MKPVILIVLDGWGLAAASAGNAITQANTVNMNRFWASYPHTSLRASGDAVGLPRGEVGNTETGHLNLGAGRIVYQDLERINISIADGTFFDNKTLIGAIEHAQNNNSNLHLMGLIGAGGVHSNINHLYALIRLAKMKNFNRVYLDLFTDGRDSPPTSAMTYINEIRENIKKNGIGTIASVMGRYWAMDRDRRWDRTEKAYKALTNGSGHLVKTVEEAIELSYKEAKTDEFVEPSLIADPSGFPVAKISDNDAVIFFNFRIDRPRQLTGAFILPDFSAKSTSFGFDPYKIKYEFTHQETKPVNTTPPFERGKLLKNLYFVTMTEYDKALTAAGAKAAYPPEVVQFPLGRIIAEQGLRQLRMSESEKERFVTFYFNGQQEIPFSEEDRIIIPSPKVPTYDQKPEMSAKQLTDSLIAQLQENTDYAFALVNFANADMIVHTGNIGAAVTACNVLDECLGRIANFIFGFGGILLITSDHGNAEDMINTQTGEIETENSTNPVPFIAVARELLGRSQTLPQGILGDVAPTILSLLKIPQPSSMTGRNLLGILDL